MALSADGLDEQNQEALDYAAEIIQIEAEAFYVHQRAQQAGHSGFNRDRGFGKGKGKMSADERKARIDAIKRKTQCRKCGQTRHLSTDYVCPKNRKGASKGPPSSTTSSPSHGSPGKGGS